MHQPLLLCLGLLLAVCLLIPLSQRWRVPYPVLLVLSGLAISWLPGLPVLEINPDVIFLLFLPALLYEAAWLTSWKDFWKWRRLISFLAFGLVFLTAGSVAVVAAAVIPGCTLALGFVLGGIVSPPDAVAASSVLRTLAVPRRLLAVLEGESLVNDASSLIVLRFALTTVLSGTFVWQQAATSLVLVTGVGIAVGLAVALVFYALHRWLPTSPSTHTVLTLVAPYGMYLLAEAAHVSGAMAVVSGGLFLSYHSARLFSPAHRQQGLSTWATVGVVLNGAVFLLIGLQLPLILRGLQGYSLPQALGYGLLIAGVVVVTRLVVAQLASAFSHWVSRFVRVSDANPGWRGPLVAGYAGMRGVVSLAAALSIPLLGSDGQPFPQRNLLLFITFVVILVTLVGQGLTLPLLIRWVGVPDADTQPSAQAQQLAARHQLATTALHRLAATPGLPGANRFVPPLHSTLENEWAVTVPHQSGPEATRLAAELADYQRLQADLLAAQRAELHHLHGQEAYDDEVIRHLEAQLDAAAQTLAFFATDPPRDTAPLLPS
jgi:Na+/H+ antiporter